MTTHADFELVRTCQDSGVGHAKPQIETATIIGPAVGSGLLE